MTDARHEFMREAIALSSQNVMSGDGGPFGAVIVKKDDIVARGRNLVTSTNDPTAHAEVVAIRQACQALGTFQLKGCDIYTSCEPCPMCMGAIYWARPDRVYYANTHADAAHIGFDDQFIYSELNLPIDQRKFPMTQLLPDEARAVFRAWTAKADKTEY
ncbi:MAG: nucleoside deaminase [Elainellaceae cyanobacterium]